MIREPLYKTELLMEAIDKCCHSSLAFYAYRLPNQIHIGFGASKYIETGLKSNGFVVAPFNTSEGISTIPMQLSPQKAIELSAIYTLPEEYVTPPEETEEKIYLKSIADTVKYLDKHDGKIVISRIILHKTNHKPHKIFHLLLDRYPSAFIFIFKINNNIWIGASPELLLSSSEDTLSTMALAGTRAANTEGLWDAKNIHEQDIVTKYICNTFLKNHLHPIVSQPLTYRAGPVEHICTRIKAKLNDRCNITDLLSDLSPTPALAGYPKEEALQFISKTEQHSRKYYGGFLGPYINNTDFSFYVNLRSMNLITKTSVNSESVCVLYCGGGITKESSPEEEFLETEMKSKTLLKLL